ncbi:ribosome biogenesis GTPase YlqF, partial [Sulfolobus sp. A20-N-F8]
QELFPLNFLFETSYKLLSRLYPKRIEELKLTPSSDEIEIYSNLELLATNLNFYKIKNSKTQDKNTELDLNRTMQ